MLVVDGVLAWSVSGVVRRRWDGGAGDAGGDGGNVGDSGRGMLFSKSSVWRSSCSVYFLFRPEGGCDDRDEVELIAANNEDKFQGRGRRWTPR